jgi:polyphosphate kinase 2 (PPK2 family)
MRAKGARLVVGLERLGVLRKGGTVERVTEHLNPRGRADCGPVETHGARARQVVLQLYITLLPAAGEIARFDRGWDGRAGVEHAMGFCAAEEHQRPLAGARPSGGRWSTNGG